MKSFVHAIILLAFAVGSPRVQAQPYITGSVAQKSPAVVGEVERAGGQIHLVLTNPTDASAFQGSASVTIGSSTGEAIRLTIALAPGETRRFPITASAASSDQYSLTVYNQTGALVLHKIAQICR